MANTRKHTLEEGFESFSEQGDLDQLSYEKMGVVQGVLSDSQLSLNEIIDDEWRFLGEDPEGEKADEKHFFDSGSLDEVDYGQPVATAANKPEENRSPKEMLREGLDQVVNNQTLFEMAIVMEALQDQPMDSQLVLQSYLESALEVVFKSQGIDSEVLSLLMSEFQIQSRSGLLIDLMRPADISRLSGEELRRIKFRVYGILNLYMKISLERVDQLIEQAANSNELLINRGRIGVMQSLKGSVVQGKKLGEGAFGVHVEALDKSLAIKVREPFEGSIDENAISTPECRHEIKQMGQDHEEIMQYYAFDEVDFGHGNVQNLDLFKVMPGSPDHLYKVPEAEMLSDPDQRHRFAGPFLHYRFKKFLKGLSHLHKKGYVHRDLKPENVLFSDLQPWHEQYTGDPEKDQRVQIIDLDFMVKMSKNDKTGKSEFISKNSTAIGTPGYMSTEQLGYNPKTASREQIVLSEKTDMFAVGVMLYDVFSGIRFNANSEAAAKSYIIKLIRGEYMQDAEIDALGLPKDLADLIKRCVDPNPDIRPTAQAAMDIINNVIESEYGGTDFKKNDPYHRLLRTHYQYEKGLNLEEVTDLYEVTPPIQMPIGLRPGDVAIKGSDFSSIDLPVSRPQPRAASAAPVTPLPGIPDPNEVNWFSDIQDQINTVRAEEKFHASIPLDENELSFTAKEQSWFSQGDRGDLEEISPQHLTVEPAISEEELLTQAELAPSAEEVLAEQEKKKEGAWKRANKWFRGARSKMGRLFQKKPKPFRIKGTAAVKQEFQYKPNQLIYHQNTFTFGEQILLDDTFDWQALADKSKLEAKGAHNDPLEMAVASTLNYWEIEANANRQRLKKAEQVIREKLSPYFL